MKQEAFTEDGWYLTADIGMMDDDKRLHIIDRKKNVLELYVKGRSVWIPTGKLEAVYQEASWVHQLFIHGERTQEHLVAVAVLDKNMVRSGFIC